jgi:hypothetical protein
MATKISARERKLQVQLKEGNEKYSALQDEHEGLWTDFAKVQKFSSERVGEIEGLKAKYEPKILPAASRSQERLQRQQQRTELERIIRQRIAENLADVNVLPWLIGTDAEAASTKIDVVVALLNRELNKSEEALTKTLRVVRNAVLIISGDVNDRECAVMLQCPCTNGKQHHHPWPYYTAGCFSEESDDNTRIGGRLWDVAEFVRLHSGYETPKLVAQTAIFALQQLAKELQSKEEDLTRLVEKIRKETAENPRPGHSESFAR